MQGDDGFDLFFASQHAALELEVLETVALIGRFSQGDDGFGVHGRLMAQAQPVVSGIGLRAVGQVALLAVTNVKKIAQHGYRIALLAFTEQRSHRNAQKLAEQIEQGAFHGRDGVNGHAQVKGLAAAACAVALRKAAA